MTHSKDKTETQKGLKPQISDLNVLTSFNVPKPVCKLGRRLLIFAILPVFLWSVSFQIKKKGILETSLEERGVLEKAKKDGITWQAATDASSAVTTEKSSTFNKGG